MGLGTIIIIVAVVFAFLKLLNPPPTGSALTQNLGELIYVIIEVLFLSVMIWGGTILLDRGLKTTP